MASRQGFDLFNKYGRRAFFSRNKTYRRWHYVWRDTFGRFPCFFLGHDTYETDEGLIACKRCGHYVKDGI
jgi:hypothetical protein